MPKVSVWYWFVPGQHSRNFWGLQDAPNNIVICFVCFRFLAGCSSETENTATIPPWCWNIYWTWKVSDSALSISPNPLSVRKSKKLTHLCWGRNTCSWFLVGCSLTSRHHHLSRWEYILNLGTVRFRALYRSQYIVRKSKKLGRLYLSAPGRSFCNFGKQQNR